MTTLPVFPHMHHHHFIQVEPPQEKIQQIHINKTENCSDILKISCLAITIVCGFSAFIFSYQSYLTIE